MLAQRVRDREVAGQPRALFDVREPARAEIDGVERDDVGECIAAAAEQVVRGIEPGGPPRLGQQLAAEEAQPLAIDAHVLRAARDQPSYLHLLAARQAEATLMRGFTTVRDLGGPVFGLKRAIDEGVMIGPRIYPSGAFILQTSGHGDFRFAFRVPRLLSGPLSYSEVEGIAAIADSPDEVRLRTREQLRQGASQIKLMAGGGVSSPYNPIKSTHTRKQKFALRSKPPRIGAPT